MLCIASLPARADTIATEAEVKAAYLFNFAKFIRWPASAFADEQSPIRICVAGNPQVAAVLRDILHGKQIEHRSVNTVTLTVEEPSVQECQILYYTPGSGLALEDLLDATHQRPVVTIGETEGFLDRGGMINFLIVDQRVRFEVNLTAVRDANVNMSSRLMGVAVRVRD